MLTLRNDARLKETFSYAYIVPHTEERLSDMIELIIHMESLIENIGSDIAPPISTSYQTARRLAGLTATTDFLIHFCTALWLSEIPLAKQMLPSAGEDLRIRGALLRFQLYNQRFHHPEATDESVTDRDWEQRHHQDQ